MNRSIDEDRAVPDPSDSGPGSLWGRSVAWVLAGGGSLGLAWAMGSVCRHLLRLGASPTPLRADEVVTLLLAATALVVAAWFAASVALSALALLPGPVGRAVAGLADRVAPAAARRAAAFLVGVSLSAALAPGTSAASEGSPTGHAEAAAGLPAPGYVGLPSPDFAGPPAPGYASLPSPGFAATSAEQPLPEPGWTPSRPLVRPQPDAALVTAGADADEKREVVVHRGDTLWGIAARDLGDGATDAEIAAAWPRWFEANREVVGPDPHLLLPGQVLRPPTPESVR
jgi:nucleoid-associated protein YgaU